MLLVIEVTGRDSGFRWTGEREFVPWSGVLANGGWWRMSWVGWADHSAVVIIIIAIFIGIIIIGYYYWIYFLDFLGHIISYWTSQPMVNFYNLYLLLLIRLILTQYVLFLRKVYLLCLILKLPIKLCHISNLLKIFWMENLLFTFFKIRLVIRTWF